MKKENGVEMFKLTDPDVTATRASSGNVLDLPAMRSTDDISTQHTNATPTALKSFL